MNHVICYSGGHSSAICAIEVARRYGAENTILLNHNISPEVESWDIKRFKHEVSSYLGIPITYANHATFASTTPIQVCVKASAWKVGSGSILCTSRLKTEPFERWLAQNDPDGENIYYYGFDRNEKGRITRRSRILGLKGYKTDYPMLWERRTIFSTEEIGIDPPNTYEKFRHANCIGCLKAGWQHWYVVYIERPDIYKEAMEAEETIGYSLHKERDGPVYLEDKIEMFEQMKAAGVEPTELENPQRFWTDAKRKIKEFNEHHQQQIPLCQLDDAEESDKGVCLECIA